MYDCMNDGIQKSSTRFFKSVVKERNSATFCLVCKAKRNFMQINLACGNIQKIESEQTKGGN